MKTRAFKHRGDPVKRRRHARMSRMINMLSSFNDILGDMQFVAAPLPMQEFPPGATTIYTGRRPYRLIDLFKASA